MWRVPARRVPLAELLEQRLFGRVGARPGQPVDLVALQQVEHAPVGERPHAKAPEPDQRLLVVERLRQQRPRLGQEGRALPRLAFLEEEPRVLYRDGRLRGEERERRQPVGGEGSRDEIVLEVEEPYELMAHDGEAEDRPRRVAGEVRIRRELAGAGRNVLDDHRLPREAHVVHDGYGQRGVPRAPRGLERQRRQDPGGDCLALEGSLGLDEELALAREEELPPAGAALLEHDLEQGPDQLLDLYLAG